MTILVTGPRAPAPGSALSEPSGAGWKWLPSAAGAVAAAMGLGWAGLQVWPAPFPPVGGDATEADTIPIPEGLPGPVERFYRITYGARVPIVRTAVITGRGTMRLFNVRFPARFRFTHEVGRDYRHYFELTLFGLPVMKANEYYVGGRERMELPMGVQDDNPKLDQGGNLGMWAELLKWVPSAALTDPHVRWEPIDDATAIFVVPFGHTQERFVVRFDPVTGTMQHVEAMRYRSGEGEKILWIDGAWFDEGSPWAAFDAEEIALNVPVTVSVDAKGP
jgi:hypothetical protein